MCTTSADVQMIDAATSIIAGGNRALYEHLFKNYRKEVRPIDYKNPCKVP